MNTAVQSLGRSFGHEFPVSPPDPWLQVLYHLSEIIGRFAAWWQHVASLPKQLVAATPSSQSALKRRGAAGTYCDDGVAATSRHSLGNISLFVKDGVNRGTEMRGYPIENAGTKVRAACDSFKICRDTDFLRPHHERQNDPAIQTFIQPARATSVSAGNHAAERSLTFPFFRTIPRNRADGTCVGILVRGRTSRQAESRNQKKKQGSHIPQSSNYLIGRSEAAPVPGLAPTTTSVFTLSSPVKITSSPGST